LVLSLYLAYATCLAPPVNENGTQDISAARGTFSRSKAAGPKAGFAPPPGEDLEFVLKNLSRGWA